MRVRRCAARFISLLHVKPTTLEGSMKIKAIVAAVALAVTLTACDDSKRQAEEAAAKAKAATEQAAAAAKAAADKAAADAKAAADKAAADAKAAVDKAATDVKDAAASAGTAAGAA